MKTYFVSPINKKSLFRKCKWAMGTNTIFEHCCWVDGVISISVPSESLNFDPYLIIKNAENEWKEYDHDIIEGFDGNIWWEYDEFFEREEWYKLSTKPGTDIREELLNLGWKKTETELFIDGEIEIEPDSLRKIRNNYNLEW